MTLVETININNLSIEKNQIKNRIFGITILIAYIHV